MANKSILEVYSEADHFVFAFMLVLFGATIIALAVDNKAIVEYQEKKIDSLTALNDTLSMELHFFKKYIGEDSTWVAERTQNPTQRK
jgi:hypothetical protein